jgi:meso-butanediol dehydrogenase/(S,S)-butanediol dehydrogenase/diacetyl reductase
VPDVNKTLCSFCRASLHHVVTVALSRHFSIGSWKTEREENTMRLAGKRVLLTGTGTVGGQGSAIQELFAHEGARVFGCDLAPGAAEATAAGLRAEGYDVTGSTVDLADPAAAEAWIEAGAEQLGGIDVLYNNAAGHGFAPFAEMTLETWRHVMRTELDILFHTTRPAWRHLQASGAASVINTASMSGVRGIAPLGQAAHSAAKGGVIGLTRRSRPKGPSTGSASTRSRRGSSRHRAPTRSSSARCASSSSTCT